MIRMMVPSGDIDAGGLERDCSGMSAIGPLLKNSASMALRISIVKTGSSVEAELALPPLVATTRTQ